MALSIAGRDPGDTPQEAEVWKIRKAECAHALMSDIGHSTVGYADKMAYDRNLHEKCKGFDVGGKEM